MWALEAPALTLADLIAPIAPAPFTPAGSAPLKLTTVIDDCVDCDNVAVTVTPLNALGEKARQTSDVPFWTFVRTTICQVRPAPDIPVTLVLLPNPRAAVATTARTSSFPAVVENAFVVRVVAADAPSPNATASLCSCAVFVTVTV